MLRSLLCELLDTIDIAYCEFDEDLCAVGWNATFLEFFPEHAPHIYVGEHYSLNLRRFYQTRLAPEEMPLIERYVAEGLARHQQQLQPFDFTHRNRTVRVSSLPLPHGGRVRIWKEVGSLPAAARTSATPAFDALDNIADGACVTGSDGGILAVNDHFRELYDVPSDCPIVGRSLEEIFADAWHDQSPPSAAFDTIRNRLRYDGAPFEVELPRDRWRRVITRQTGDGHAYTIHADISGLKREQRELIETQESLKAAIAELDNLARRDALTGLPNRRLFDAELAASADGACVLIIDVDHFKEVNDTYGHAAGDACLRRVAGILDTIANRAGAKPARIGGEEFAVLVDAAGDEAAADVAEAIRAGVAAADFADIAPGIRLTVSIGVGATEGTGIDRQAAADRALYRAKAAGRNAVRIELAGTARNCA